MVHQKGKNIMGIDWAPMNVPWHQRMETLCIFFVVLQFLCCEATGTILILYMDVYTRYYMISLLYLAWYFYDVRTTEFGGRRFYCLRNWSFWTRVADYFPIQLIKTAELNPIKNYLFVSHPHVVLSCGVFASFATGHFLKLRLEATDFSKKFPGFMPHLVVLNLWFKYFLFREYLMGYGLCSASRASIDYLLSRPEGGHVAVVMPGGAAEGQYARPGSECTLLLKRRKGFIKAALANGASLVPVFCFGENDVYNQLFNEEGSRVRRIQIFLTKILTFAPLCILGRGICQYSFGLLPHRRPITVVVGEAIPIEKREQPTQKEVDDLHEKYTKCLLNLFETHKAAYGMKNSRLKLV